jgi:hypothetical protein
MTDIEAIARERLERRYPPLEREPDWDDVLQRLAQREPAKKRRARYGVVLVAAGLAAALVLVLLAPWHGSPSFTQQALAAVGGGRYIYVILDSSDPYSKTIDLSSGRSRPNIQRQETVYDTRTGSLENRFSFNEAVFEPQKQAPPSPGPLITNFVSGYRNALKSREARIVGETTVDGQEAKILRFSFPIRDREGKVVLKDRSYEDVAVATDSFTPLWIRLSYRVFPQEHLPESHVYAPPCPCTRVISIRSSDERPTLPTPRKWPRSVSGDVTDIRVVDPADASAALRHPALWAGAIVGETILQKVLLQQVTTELISGPVQNWRQLSSARGLRLEYRGDWRTLVIEEVATPQGGYGFGNGFQPLPPLGQASLACDLCQTPRDTPGLLGDPSRVWAAQLRKDGLFVRIRSTSRSLVVHAARALRPTP